MEEKKTESERNKDESQQNKKKYKKRYIIATELFWSIKEQNSYLVVKQ